MTNASGIPIPSPTLAPVLSEDDELGVADAEGEDEVVVLALVDVDIEDGVLEVVVVVDDDVVEISELELVI
jgi:hypothetical protein